MLEQIKKAREFYGIHKHITDDAVERLIGFIKTQSFEWVREYIRLMDLSYKAW